MIAEDFLTEHILDPVITYAGSFKQASEMLLPGDTVYDLILLDLSLPDKSGQDLVISMLSIAVGCPVIILTGYTDIDFSIRSISMGVYDYLLKDDLTSTILYKSILYTIERKKANAELIESEKRYSELFHLSPQPGYLFDVETYTFTQVNQAATLLYGYSEKEFLNLTLMDIKIEEDICKENEDLNKTYNTSETYKSTVMHRTKSGAIIEVEIYSNPLTIKNKSYMSVIAIDVTEKNRFEHEITKAIIKTQEDERYEIGGELHDNVCQILATSKLTLGMLKGSLPASDMQWFNQCNDYIVLATEEIRNLSHRLAPTFFNDSTLEEAFGLLLHSFNIGGKYNVFLNVDIAVKKYIIPLDVQLNLYRILQEQLKNILKYARAKTIEVDLIIFNKKLKMKISDDGVGFDINAVKKGIGIANMKRRAYLFSGKFNLISSPDKGCTVIVDIPL